MTSSDNNGKSPSFWLLAMLAVFIVGVLGAAWYYIPILYPRSEEAGQFGDMFGGVNALFGGLAFAGVIFAILLQKKELQLQRQELKETREELKGQKEQLEAQNKTFQKQSFENTFFSLLRFHGDLVRSIQIRKRTADFSGLIEGKACFVKFYDSFRLIFQSPAMDYANMTDDLQKIEAAYGHFFGEHQSHVDLYFRNFYYIITYINNSDIDDKRLYTNTVRAQLSSHELLLLFYHCLTQYGKPLKPLVEEFALLKNVLLYKLINDAHTRYYRTSAFDEE